MNRIIGAIIAEALSDAIKETVKDQVVEEGREAVAEAVGYIGAHKKAAGMYIKHLESCESCAALTERNEAAALVKLTAEKALDAIKDFMAAEEALAAVSKQIKEAGVN